MIDAKTLAEGEKNLLEIVSRYPDAKRLLMGEVEIIRLARRHLAFRNELRTKEGRIRMQGIIWNMNSRKDLDAALDKLLDGE